MALRSASRAHTQPSPSGASQQEVLGSSTTGSATRKMSNSDSAAALVTFVRRPLMGERGALIGSSMIITAARGAVAMLMLCIRSSIM